MAEHHRAHDLVAWAEALGPALRERVPLTRELRQVPPATIEDLHQAGFFRMLQPQSRGGFEVHPNTFFEVQIALAAACPSTAWVMSVLAVHAWQLALFDPKAQEEVWADERALISSSYAPTGKVKRVEGGFHLSGRWSFSSGCDHCGWIFLGGMVPPREEGGQPQMRTFLVPRSDWSIEDNWHVAGLVGTGSKDIVVEGCFVPEHRTHRFIDGFTGKNHGGHEATLYRLPFGQIFVRSVSTSSVGCLQGALAAYLDVGRKKLAASTGERVAVDPSPRWSAPRPRPRWTRCAWCCTAPSTRCGASWSEGRPSLSSAACSSATRAPAPYSAAPRPSTPSSPPAEAAASSSVRTSSASSRTCTGCGLTSPTSPSGPVATWAGCCLAWRTRTSSCESP